MGTGTLILIVIILVVGVYFYAEISAIINDYSAIYTQLIIDQDFKIDAPKAGQTVCDLIVTIDVRSFSAISGSLVSTERILFTDGKEGKQIGWNWNNCHKYTSGLLSLSIFDSLANPKLTTLEFFIPAEDFADQKIILSYTLIEDNTGLKKKLPLYQNITYTHPAFQINYDFSQQLKFRDLLPANYTLEIIPNEAHFEDKKVGEPLKKSIYYSE